MNRSGNAFLNVSLRVDSVKSQHSTTTCSFARPASTTPSPYPLRVGIFLTLSRKVAGERCAVREDMSAFCFAIDSARDAVDGVHQNADAYSKDHEPNGRRDNALSDHHKTLERVGDGRVRSKRLCRHVQRSF